MINNHIHTSCALAENGEVLRKDEERICNKRHYEITSTRSHNSRSEVTFASAIHKITLSLVD